MYQNPPRPRLVLLALFAMLFFGGSYVVSPEPTNRGTFQVRLAADDPATGEVLRDNQLIWAASVLAAWQRYAHLATASGLVIAELNLGSSERITLRSCRSARVGC